MRMVARMVKSHGHEFESTLRERETGKPHFGFMWDAKVSHQISISYQLFRSVNIK